MVLGCSIFASLLLLSDHPLLNPVQAAIPAFYWWFGIGPAVIATHKALMGYPGDALYVQEASQEALWIVAIGLPLYAVGARMTLSWFATRNVYARFLMPHQRGYRVSTVVTLFVIGLLCSLSIWLLNQIGIIGVEDINYLGGTITNIWWIGLISAVGMVTVFARSAVLSEMVQSGRESSRVLKWMAVVVIVQSLLAAMTSGWKSTFILTGMYVLCAYVSKHQRIPWISIATGLLLYLLIIEPFVSAGRSLAQSLGISTTQERSRVYAELISEGRMFEQLSMREINIESPFRGMHLFASEVVRRNTPATGEWAGDTIVWGLATLIPRRLSPNKPDMNVGNFFSRTIGVDLNLSSSRDYFTNTSIALPFEFVGNFGWLAGIVSFGCIGVFWASLTSWILSTQRLSDHPLTPWLTANVLLMESAVGHYLAYWRSMLFPLVTVFVVWIVFRRRL